MGNRMEIKPAYPGQEIVVLADFDDSVVGRERITRGVGKLIRMLKPHSLSKKTLADYPEINCTPVDRHLNISEAISAFFHLRRKPIDGIAEALQQVTAEGGKIVVASGRKATAKMHNGTKAQAEQAGLNIAEIILTPDGLSGKVVKAVTAKRVGATHIVEDDPDTIKFVKREVPGIQVIHIDHNLHLDKKFMAENPDTLVYKAKDLRTKRKAEGASETRNSPLREKVSIPVEAITRAVHRELPWLTPTHLNILGAAEVLAGAVVAGLREPKKKGGEKLKTGISLALVIKGSLLDAFDGSLARLKASEDPNSVDFKKGGIYDVLSDRFQELVLAESRAVSAVKRKSKIGAAAALASAVTNPWPSITRAFSELRGKPVPESGRGIFGLIGTRPGKAVLGTLATEYPNPKGLPLQPAIDIAITASNLITAGQRMRNALGPAESMLSEVIKDEARTRLTFLAGAGLFAAVAGLGTAWLLKDKLTTKESRIPADLLAVISATENYCRSYALNHRFVGGIVTEFIGPKTGFNIDVKNRTVTLINPVYPKLRRTDGTVRDIDMIAFTPHRYNYIAAKTAFARQDRQMEEKGILFPRISIEAATHSDWPKRSRLKQFVTAWEVDRNGTPSLSFGEVRRIIRLQSIEPWTLDTGLDVRMTMLNPVAHALCYELRVPSGVKKKDREELGSRSNSVIPEPYSKISLVREMARQTIEQGKQQDCNFDAMFRSWRWYIDDLKYNPDPVTAVKGRITGLWWNTVGEWVTHRFTGGNDKMAD